MEEHNIGQEQVVEKFQGGISQAEETRKEGYGTALTMMEHRHTSQQRERDRLALKYGEKHERVVAMDRRLAGNAVIGKAAKTQQSRATYTVSAPERGQWKMMGRVVNDKGLPLPGLTVSLFGKNGWESRLGFTCTDDMGFYTLLVADYQLVASYDCHECLPTVTDKDKEILHQESQPVVIEQGRTVVRNMIISSKKCAAPGNAYGVWSDMPPSHGGSGPEGGMVWGMVRTAEGHPVTGLRVRAKSMYNQNIFELGKGDTTDQQGKYVINFGPDSVGLHAFEGDLTISILLYNERGKVLLETPPKEFSPYASRIDIDLDAQYGEDLDEG
jgi:hypothetical protein